MKRVSEDWYQGTADAVFQNFQSIEAEAPELTPDSRRRSYLQNELPGDAGLAPAAECRRHDRHHPGAPGRGAAVSASPKSATTIESSDLRKSPSTAIRRASRFDPDMVSASMGIYLFDTKLLLEALHEDSQVDSSAHDFGKDVIPRLLSKARIVAYDFRDLNAKQSRYWRDVGTLDAYYEANMDLVDVVPEFNLYDKDWPIRTNVTQQPPAKFVFAQEGRRMGVAVDSVVSAGSIVSGGRVLHSVLSPGVRVNSYCEVEYSILMPGSEIGRYSRIRRAIVNTGVKVPDSSVIGFDLEADRAKGYHVTDAGIVVVA